MESLIAEFSISAARPLFRVTGLRESIQSTEKADGALFRGVSSSASICPPTRLPTYTKASRLDAVIRRSKDHIARLEPIAT